MSMLRDIKSGAESGSPDGPLVPDDLLNATMTTVNTDASGGNDPDEALNAASPEPQASEASLNNSSAQRLHSGRGPLGPVLQQSGQRIGEVPRQQQLGNRGNNGRVLVGDRVDGTWEVRVSVQRPQEPVDDPDHNRSRGSRSAREHNVSQQSWSVWKAATPRKVRRPVHVVHRHHHHHYHHHYFPVEGDEIPASAFVEASGDNAIPISDSNAHQTASGRFAPTTSPFATPPAAGNESSEHRHFHYHHHAQSIGIPGHAQKLLDASDQKQLEADIGHTTSPFPLSRTGGVDAYGSQHQIHNMPGTRLPSLI